ncbi:uncharacterized protein LAESUDRAFT_327174 [Laetiporus sulphureus 93-53]|uniref:Uncharacterized protein n=1 Tax=Laetiporus sulphureus 93-53 TaxID=1314785 RepID=A0A165D035_9APHY|nr:uncharacterized protein LAESUDRAFT_327174 [Laetiporus sulphureus 93-53]KZT03864.1 hypothetical protein LAESUDRAFT_327174 [Laetiporus sulphureus 93-53]
MLDTVTESDATLETAFPVIAESKIRLIVIYGLLSIKYISIDRKMFICLCDMPYMRIAPLCGLTAIFSSDRVWALLPFGCALRAALRFDMRLSPVRFGMLTDHRYPN